MKMDTRMAGAWIIVRLRQECGMEWVQVYNPLGHPALSTLAAAVPIVTLLATLAVLQWPAHRAALAGLGVALVVAVGVFGMPVASAAAAAVRGGAYGLFPIGWIIVNALFLYNLTVQTGTFETIRLSVARVSPDRRIQALLIAFSFGAFIEGASGFGTPVAISAALLMGLGFPPLQAAGLSLIANTAPVAFGAIGTPILTLAAVTGIPSGVLSAVAGRQLPFVSVLVPAWLVVTMSGWRGLRGVWPAVLVAGGTFAIVQAAWSNLVGPELVDIMAAIASLGAMALFCRKWQPREAWDFSARIARGLKPGSFPNQEPHARDLRRLGRHVPVATVVPRGAIVRAWMPWVFLSLFVVAWGLTPVKALLNGGPAGMIAYSKTGKPPAPNAVLSPVVAVPRLHCTIFREYPVEPRPVDRTLIRDAAYRAVHAEAATFTFNWLSATGTAILFAALVSALFLRVRARDVAAVGWRTLVQLRWPLVTIALMLALGDITHYGGTDATLGLAFTRTGRLYPFFAAMLGWLGVALTGSDTSSNVLFGSLQTITAQQLQLNPALMAAANSTGGVMGKMIAAQNIVVGTAATNQQGQEGRLLRFVFWHSVALAVLMGLIVLAQAYWLAWMLP
jgi:lactate permease